MEKINLEDYNIILFKEITNCGIEYGARIEEFKGCIGSGDSYQEAIDDLSCNLNAHIEFLQEEGIEIPLPIQESKKYSGKILVRVSPLLHSKVASTANSLNISTNQLIVESIAQMTGFIEGSNKALEAVDKKITKTVSDSVTKIEKIFDICPSKEQDYVYQDLTANELFRTELC